MLIGISILQIMKIKNKSKNFLRVNFEQAIRLNTTIKGSYYYPEKDRNLSFDDNTIKLNRERYFIKGILIRECFYKYKVKRNKLENYITLITYLDSKASSFTR